MLNIMIDMFLHPFSLADGNHLFNGQVRTVAPETFILTPCYSWVYRSFC